MCISIIKYRDFFFLFHILFCCHIHVNKVLKYILYIDKGRNYGREKINARMYIKINIMFLFVLFLFEYTIFLNIDK